MYNMEDDNLSHNCTRSYLDNLDLNSAEFPKNYITPSEKFCTVYVIVFHTVNATLSCTLPIPTKSYLNNLYSVII